MEHLSATAQTEPVACVKQGSGTATITGVSGFIGSHLCRALKDRGYYVIGGDIKPAPVPGYEPHEFYSLDLSRETAFDNFYPQGGGLLFALAADMGGMGFIGNPANDFTILTTNSRLNLLAAEAVSQFAQYKGVFFSSSACVYPSYRQDNLGGRELAESDAYPAHPDSEYGWEKLYSEHIYTALSTLEVPVWIARFHNIYGVGGEWWGGREKAPAAACRKIAYAKLTGGKQVSIWGDGQQIRSFCYIDDCINGILALISSGIDQPINIGSDWAISIEALYDVACKVAGYPVEYVFDMDKPQGVRYRNADLTLARHLLGWEPYTSLYDGLVETYEWIEGEVAKKMEEKRGTRA